MWKYDVAIVGMGYVGLPLARQAVSSNLKVVGIDIDADVVYGLSEGCSHIDDVADAEVLEMLAAGFEVTTDPQIVGLAETICICVPTPLSDDGGPDLKSVLAASRDIASHMMPGTLVVYESTTYPGSTEEDAMPVLETSGLKAGINFNLAFSPERVDPGNPYFGVKNTPKIVGGFTEACRSRAIAHYQRFIDTVVPAKGLREAEMAKLLENTYRHVNIALVNEMAKFSHELGIDIWDVIACAATKPFGFQAFYPGPGVGGHCIPIDPNYLAFKVQSELGYRFRFVELAQEINMSMPLYVVDRAARILNDVGKAVNGAKILLLGVTYKEDIGDQRESPALHVAHELLKRRADLTFHDPFIGSWEVKGKTVPKADNLFESVRSADLTILLQAHSDYDDQLLQSDCHRLFDTRGRTSPKACELL